MKGRKRHIVVDTQGLLLAVAVHPADMQDRDGAKDSGYQPNEIRDFTILRNDMNVHLRP